MRIKVKRLKRFQLEDQLRADLAKVKSFHEMAKFENFRFPLPTPEETPRSVKNHTSIYNKCIQSEQVELQDAWMHPTFKRRDPIEMADALCDIYYFALSYVCRLHNGVDGVLGVYTALLADRKGKAFFLRKSENKLDFFSCKPKFRPTTKAFLIDAERDLSRKAILTKIAEILLYSYSALETTSNADAVFNAVHTANMAKFTHNKQLALDAVEKYQKGTRYPHATISFDIDKQGKEYWYVYTMLDGYKRLLKPAKWKAPDIKQFIYPHILKEAL
jgi:hypothetical protein